MKIGIVIPLKSKRISRNWAVTTESLKNTLLSIQNQTNRNFEVVVAGHEIPEDVMSEFPDFNFVTVDFPVPDRSAPDFCHRHLLIDKGLKIVRGFQALQPCGIDYWFQLDSDDLIRNDFVELLQSLEGQSGAIIQGGYFVYSSIDRVLETKEMVLYSGSTCVLAAKHVQVPTDVELDEDHMNCSPYGRYPHMTIAKYFEDEVKEEYQVITEPVLGYVLGNGDNISDARRGSWVKKLRSRSRPYLRGKKFKKTLKQRFGVE